MTDTESRRDARERLREWADQTEAVLSNFSWGLGGVQRRMVDDIRTIVKHSASAEGFEERLAEEVNLRLAAGRLNPADIERHRARSLTPFVVSVPVEHMQVAQDVMAQIQSQMRREFNAGILFMPDEMKTPGVTYGPETSRIAEELMAAMEAPVVDPPSQVGTGERWVMVGTDALVIRVDPDGDADAVAADVARYLRGQ